MRGDAHGELFYARRRKALRYQRVALILGLVSMLFLGWYVASQARPAYAQAKQATIPKSWGPCKGAVGGALIFEDSAGTVRLVDAGRGNLEVIYERR